MWSYEGSHPPDQSEQRLESVIEEAFELQTYQPFHGWIYDRFCDRTGNIFPLLSAKAINIKKDDKLNQLPQEKEYEIGVLPQGWMWSHPWIPDFEYTQCDEEGWSYGSTMAHINRRLAEGTSKIKREYYHFLRRRRWIRTRIKKPTIEMTSDTTSMMNSYPLSSSTLSKRFYHIYRGTVFSFYHFSSRTKVVQETFQDEDVLLEGWLGQRGSFSRSWKLRYFIVRQDTSTLICLRDRASLMQISETWIDRHTTLLIEESPNPHQFQFLVINGEKKLRLNAVDAMCRSAWISAISELVVRKRASFLAAEDSDLTSVGSNKTSRSGRRMRPSYSEDNVLMRPILSSSRDTSMSPCRHRKRKWRPYCLIAATMQSTMKITWNVRKAYLMDFEVEFQNHLEILRTFLEENINILEENLLTTEHMLTSIVAKVPQAEIDHLRKTVRVCIEQLDEEFNQMMRSDQGNVLQCNILRKHVYTEACRMDQMIRSFVPTTMGVDVKIKKIVNDSDKRILPTGWLMDCTDSVEDKPERSDSLPIILSPMNGIHMKSFHSLPLILCKGNLEQPNGINNYVVQLCEDDLGSMIAFTLISPCYITTLESYFHDQIDIRKEFIMEEQRMSQETSHSINPLYVNILSVQDEIKDTFTFETTNKHEFTCVIYYSAQFHALRSLCGAGNINFLCSLAESKRWETSGGKSKAFFSKTHDRRYVLKGIPVSEFNMFLHMVPEYFKFMSPIVNSSTTPTMITKILGLYKLTHVRRSHKHTTYIVVMENIAYGFSKGQIYDIKGITRRRYSMLTDEENEMTPRSRDLPSHDLPCTLESRPVLLDGNLIERVPIPVRQQDLDQMELAIQHDTEFLCRAGVIDYSMLMIFDEEKRQVIVGLIDYLHQFDFLKKMESTSKASLTFRHPTIISPFSYRRRFMNAIHRYFVGIEQELELRICQSKYKRERVKKNSSSPPNEMENLFVYDKIIRSYSEGIIPTHTFDQEASLAHSDGDECASNSSDERCLRGSIAHMTQNHSSMD